ncbi:transposase [Streptomyces sp. NPDC007355]|uniref:transposase n=1 Tax=Streptomyces sp. NPDC007355 TaxID=3364778 RepID=UPI00367DF4C8
MMFIMDEHGEKRQSRPRRSFTREFKAEIVELCRRGDRSVGQVAQDFDLTETEPFRVRKRLDHLRCGWSPRCGPATRPSGPR